MKRRGPYKTRPAEGTVSALIRLYRESPRYLSWRASTARRADTILDGFDRANPGLRVRDITRGDMIRARDSLANTPAAANNWLKIMRPLLDYAVDLEWIAVSPLTNVRPLASRNPDGFATWSEDDIDRFLDRWALGSVPHRSLTLMLYTAASRADVVRLGWQNVAGDRIRYRRAKMTGGPLIDIPILPPLAELLATLPRDRMTFLETRFGRPRSAAALTEDMRRWTEAAGLAPGLTCHGLRKAQGRRLAEAGCSPHEIMAWLGHKSLAMAAHYSKAYDRARATDAAAERLANISPPATVVRLAKKANDDK